MIRNVLRFHAAMSRARTRPSASSRWGGRATRSVASHGAAGATDADTPGPVCRILAPTAILGYGFPRASFDAALHAHPIDVFAVDAGSIDPGPCYLATRQSFTSEEHVERDLRIMLEGWLQQQRQLGSSYALDSKLIVGSAGGCGTDNQVFAMAAMIRRLLRQLVVESGDEAMRTSIATVTSELRDPATQLAGRTLTPLGPMPDDRGDGGKLQPGVVVAQMGLDPVMRALEHASIVVCGRAYDPAVFAAEPVRRGFPAATALHAAKVLECGAIAATPGSGSDCLVAELRMDGVASIYAPNTQRTATPLSVAAHTLYEKSHPHLFGLPGGVLDTTGTTFTQRVDSDTARVHVDVRGTRLRRTPPTVKLEGARVRGHRAVRLTAHAPDSSDGGGGDGTTAGVSRFTYGIHGVEERSVDIAHNERELALVVAVRGADASRVNSHLALLRATLLHWGFPGRKATAGNFAFPFSPSDLVVVDGGGSASDGEARVHEALTVCGTRDPLFIAQWETIVADASAYVHSLAGTDADGGADNKPEVSVSVHAFGLEGMPQLSVVEVVADSSEAAVAMLRATAPPSEGGGAEWLCAGSTAADFTLHHLLDVDDDTMRSLFRIEVSQWSCDDDGTDTAVAIDAELVPWGLEAGPVVPIAEAMASAAESAKPTGCFGIAGGGKRSLLRDMATVIRSKNAGANEITYDIMFDDLGAYEACKRSPLLDAGPVEALLRRRVLGVYADDTSMAVKITCARGVLAGGAGDRDVYGAQQHSALLRVVV